MRAFPDAFFDRVICSRTVQELSAPAAVILEALRVGRALTVGFVNHGYWKNRLDAFFLGRKPRNPVYTTDWFESRPANPVTVDDFEQFCAAKGIRIARRALLRGDWKSRCALPAEPVRRLRALRPLALSGTERPPGSGDATPPARGTPGPLPRAGAGGVAAPDKKGRSRHRPARREHRAFVNY